MTIGQILAYLPLAVVLGYLFWRALKFKRAKARLSHVLTIGGQIVDVREPAEFRAGSNPQAINIPLSEIEARAHSLDKAKPVVLCCASGMRSGMAASALRRLGFKEVINLGPWTNTL